MAQRNTRLVLRNDNSENWNLSGDVVLFKGEPGLEFQLKEGKQIVKIKIGDGITPWKNLPYYGDLDSIFSKIEELEKQLKNKEASNSGEILILNCGGAAE